MVSLTRTITYGITGSELKFERCPRYRSDGMASVVSGRLGNCHNDRSVRELAWLLDSTHTARSCRLQSTVYMYRLLCFCTCGCETVHVEGGGGEGGGGLGGERVRSIANLYCARGCTENSSS